MQRIAEPAARMGALLRAIEQAQLKSCDTDARGCGALNRVRHELVGDPPRVFTVQVRIDTIDMIHWYHCEIACDL